MSRPSMLDLNVPCDDCSKNVAGIFICTGCWERARAEARRQALEEAAQELDKYRRYRAREMNETLGLASSVLRSLATREPKP